MEFLYVIVAVAIIAVTDFFAGIADSLGSVGM